MQHAVQTSPMDVVKSIFGEKLLSMCAGYRPGESLWVHSNGVNGKPTCKIHFTSKSCVLLYWQRCWTALQQRASAKLCGVVKGMELLNFDTERHLYSARRPSFWASAQILIIFC